MSCVHDPLSSYAQFALHSNMHGVNQGTLTNLKLKRLGGTADDGNFVN